MLLRVISGGQTGVDQAALRVALKLGLETGGWAPNGYWTQAGANPELGTLYGLREDESRDYAKRTFLNVQESDGTLRVAVRLRSPGELCTMRAIQKYRKPYFDVLLTDPMLKARISQVTRWIIDEGIRTLNVAGNSEQTSPGVGDIAEVFLLEALKPFSREAVEARKRSVGSTKLWLGGAP